MILTLTTQHWILQPTISILTLYFKVIPNLQKGISQPFTDFVVRVQRTADYKSTYLERGTSDNSRPSTKGL